MPITGNQTALRNAIATASGVTDTLGRTLLLNVATAMTTWLVANVQALPGAPPLGLKNLGPVVSGQGRFSTATAAGLGLVVGTASGSLDAPAVALWNSFATALCSHITTNGRVDSVNFVATQPTTGGPVFNLGKMSFSSSFSLGAAMSFTGANLVTWNAIGNAIVSHLVTNAQVGVADSSPSGFLSAPGGGPLTGVTVIK